MTTLARLLTLSLTVLALGCASAEIGDECDTSGAKDECVDGAICTADSGGTKTCRKSCTTDDQCGATEQCNGISGANTKSCQPKK